MNKFVLFTFSCLFIKIINTDFSFFFTVPEIPKKTVIDKKAVLTKSSCIDNTKYTSKCPEWAKKAECGKNRWMKTNCCVSCKKRKLVLKGYVIFSSRIVRLIPKIVEIKFKPVFPPSLITVVMNLK